MRFNTKRKTHTIKPIIIQHRTNHIGVWVLFTLLLVLYTVLLSTGMLQSKPDVVKALSSPVSNKQWSLYFSDEFNGSNLDTSRWKAYHNAYGVDNKEEACLTPNNVTVSGGSLKITAKRELVATCPTVSTGRDFTSGFIGSREQGRYYPAFGYYEMRAKLPHGQGVWPAFWLRHSAGASRAEVDVMEYFHSQVPGKTSQTLHFPAEIGSNVSKTNTFFENPTTNPAWQTWGVEILPANDEGTTAKFAFYQNDIKTLEYTPTAFDWLNNYNKDALFDIAINLGVGGRYTGHPDDNLGYSRYLDKCLRPYNGTQPCSGSGILRAQFPSTYEVDYVRVYQLTPAPASSGDNNGGTASVPTPTPADSTSTSGGLTTSNKGTLSSGNSKSSNNSAKSSKNSNKSTGKSTPSRTNTIPSLSISNETTHERIPAENGNKTRATSEPNKQTTTRGIAIDDNSSAKLSPQNPLRTVIFWISIILVIIGIIIFFVIRRRRKKAQ